MIKVYDENRGIVGVVKYNSDLDMLKGSNYQNGGIGRHKGLTRLKNGAYVLIYGSDWQGDESYGEIISAREALNEIIDSHNFGLLTEKKFAELNDMYEEMQNGEFGEMED